MTPKSVTAGRDGHRDLHSSASDLLAGNNFLKILKDDRFLSDKLHVDFLSQVKSQANQLPANQIPKVINEFFKYVTPKLHSFDPLNVIERFTKVFTYDKVSQAYAGIHGSKETAAERAINNAKSYFGAALHYLEMTESKQAFSYHHYMKQVTDSLLSLVETILAVYGVGDLFRSTDNTLQNDMKLQKVMTLINSFSLLTMTLQPVLGAAVTSFVVGGALFLIAALSLVYPFIKPPSSNLPLAQNITRQIEKGQIQPIEGRKEILDKIAAHLCARSHVLLIGESRVGKTLIVKAFAAAVRRGDYPALRGKDVHFIKTPDLLAEGRTYNSYGESSTGLSRISQSIHAAREHYILAFDEIQVACQAEQRHKALAENFKSMLDIDEPENFPFAIGITTQEEYNEFVRVNEAFSNRFTLVYVPSTASDETFQSMSNHLLKKSPATLLEDGATTLEYLYEQTNKLLKKDKVDPVQPYTAMKILKKCLEKTSELQSTPIDEEISRRKATIASKRAQAAVSAIGSRVLDGNDTLTQELDRLMHTAETQKKKLQEYYDSRRKLAQIKARLMKSMLTIHDYNRDGFSTQQKVELMRNILLCNSYEACEGELKDVAKGANVRLFITKELIDMTIQDEIKRQEAVEKGLSTASSSGKKQGQGKRYGLRRTV